MSAPTSVRGSRRAAVTPARLPSPPPYVARTHTLVSQESQEARLRARPPRRCRRRRARSSRPAPCRAVYCTVGGEHGVKARGNEHRRAVPSRRTVPIPGGSRRETRPRLLVFHHCSTQVARLIPAAGAGISHTRSCGRNFAHGRQGLVTSLTCSNRWRREAELGEGSRRRLVSERRAPRRTGRSPAGRHAADPPRVLTDHPQVSAAPGRTVQPGCARAPPDAGVLAELGEPVA